MTVEASIVMPVIIFCILALMYGVILMYQQAYIQSVTDRAAERGAAMWPNASKDMNLGKITKGSIADSDLYWRIYDTDMQDKKEKISSFITDRIGGTAPGFMKAQRVSEPRVEKIDWLLYKKLRVTVEVNYKIPLGSLLKPMGIGDTFKVETTSEAVINEPAEFIRNTDFAVDILDQTGVFDKINSFISRFGKKK